MKISHQVDNGHNKLWNIFSLCPLCPLIRSLPVAHPSELPVYPTRLLPVVLCELFLQLESLDEENYFHKRSARRGRPLFAGRTRWSDNLLRRADSARSKKRPDRLRRYCCANPPRSRQYHRRPESRGSFIREHRQDNNFSH